MNSALTKLKDESLQTGLKQVEISHKASSATQAYELAEIKRRLEENNALIKATASDTKDSSLSFRLDMYVNLGVPSTSDANAFL